MSDAAEDIPDARTVEELIQAVNEEYGLDLPTSFPNGTVLEQLWKVALEVKAGKLPVLYDALATEPFSFAVLDGRVHITIHSNQNTS
ncbi:hypothetical protein [Glycomyces xiaoerkulensis]|uniref:hypothetical protein n=1 Tax=Glycomyces xiaoerkulensis TaxID=2038139 RepID=UPI000C256FEA|nr:hypothetical protein [Glycomyces xiaoerkulensis]